MAIVTITYEVDSCVNDCPFCSFWEDTKQYFCSKLMGSPVGCDYTIIDRNNDKPLKHCPFRKKVQKK